jgi:ribosome-associated translation inhibitor RaiA
MRKGIGVATDLIVSTSGDVTKEDVSYARAKIERVADAFADPVLHAELRLVAAPDPARERPALAEATLDVDGRHVRAHVAAHTMTEAADLLEERLRRRMDRYQQRTHLRGRLRHETGEHAEGEWRRGDLPTQRPEWLERPTDERELVKRKTFASSPMTVEEAVDELELLGHDFHLFTELDSGAPAVVYHDDEGIALQQPAGVAAPAASAMPVRSAEAAPVIGLDEARARLDALGQRFLFFVDEGTGGGAVAYRRYDGHDGLIVIE